MFRELAPAEVDLVSGGYDAGEIVVTAPSGMDLWGYDGDSGYTPDNYGSGTFTEGDAGSSSYSCFLPAAAGAGVAEVGAWIRWILDKIWEVNKDGIKNEQNVANTFNPDNVHHSFYEGTDHVFIMNNGVRYVDTNNNGMPDVFYKYGTDGIVWGNQGAGWFDTGTRWSDIVDHTGG